MRYDPMSSNLYLCIGDVAVEAGAVLGCGVAGVRLMSTVSCRLCRSMMKSLVYVQ